MHYFSLSLPRDLKQIILMKGLIVFEGIWVYVFYINETALINDRILKLWPGLLQRAWIYLISEMCIYSSRSVSTHLKFEWERRQKWILPLRTFIAHFLAIVSIDTVSKLSLIWFPEIKYANVIKFVYYIKIYIKMKIQKIHPDSTIPKSNIKIVERGKIYTTSLFCIGTGTYIKSGGVMLVLWSPPSISDI